MAKAKKALTGKYGEAEGFIKSLVIDSEYKVAATNNQDQIADYESVLDMVELVRSEKNASWKSDIFIGLLLSHMLTDSATWAAQDFQSRDFVDVYLEGNQPDDKLKAKAAKTLINQLLNIRDVYHYQKRIRARTINWLFGQVYAVMWWEQETVKKSQKQPPLTTIVREYDAEGNIVPKILNVEQPPLEYEEVVIDRMNYDVFDSRNVFTDYSYTYSAQQKPWITFRAEKTWSQINADAEKFKYFNLDILGEKLFGDKKKKNLNVPSTETETAKESYNKLGGAYNSKSGFYKRNDPLLDVLSRYGTMWAVVKKKDEEEGFPIEIEPGYNALGELHDDAELVEAITTFAGVGDDYTMIGFQPTWAIDAKGRPFKPIIRGWCYIHPTKDIGLSDGKNLREMNIAANDTFNIGNDRDMMSTFPFFKGRRDAIENNPTVFFEPENIILLENPEKDLLEVNIRPNNGSNMQQLGFIKSTSSEMDSIWPTTMGGLPEKTSTTATAIAGAENRTGARGNLKQLTWDYTFDLEYYWMIQQMAFRFMKQETLDKMLGKELAQHFSPKEDYSYISLSMGLEAEHQKMKKVGIYDQISGRLGGLAKVIPQIIPPVAALIFGKQMELMGSEYREIAEIVNKIANAKPQEEGKGAEQVKDQKDPMTSNQSGVEVQGQEEAVRSMAGGGKKL